MVVGLTGSIYSSDVPVNRLFHQLDNQYIVHRLSSKHHALYRPSDPQWRFRDCKRAMAPILARIYAHLPVPVPGGREVRPVPENLRRPLAVECERAGTFLGGSLALHKRQVPQDTRQCASISPSLNPSSWSSNDCMRLCAIVCRPMLTLPPLGL